MNVQGDRSQEGALSTIGYDDEGVKPQFQRMPNVSLLPGETERSFEDMIAATDKGIAIVGDGSFSIDQQRYNAQFGGQVFHEIKGGKIVGMLKDVAYQMRTPEFWNSMDMIGGKQSYQLGGSLFDGKGQPPEVNAVSHGRSQIHGLGPYTVLRLIAECGDRQHREDPNRTRCIRPTPCCPCREGQGGHRDGAQAGRPLLQRAALRTLVR